MTLTAFNSSASSQAAASSAVIQSLNHSVYESSKSDLAAQLAAENQAKMNNIGYVFGESLYDAFQWLSQTVNPYNLSARYYTWYLSSFYSLQGYSPLHRAIENEDMPAVNIFMSIVDINSQISSSGNAAIHLATLQGFTKGIQALVDHGADLNLINKQGFSPLALALKNNRQDIFKALLAAGADMHRPCAAFSNRTPFQEVIELQFSFRDIVIEHILAHTTPMTANHLYDVRHHTGVPKVTPLMLAVMYHPETTIPELIAKGADINLRIQDSFNEITVTSNTIAYNHVQAVALLLSHNPDIETPYKKKGKETTLLKEGLNNPPTREVMAKHFLTKVMPSNVNQRITLDEENSITPLMLAVELNDPDTTAALLAQEADCEALQEKAGRITTPLQTALSSKMLRPIMANHILKQTTVASVNRIISFGNKQMTTPLMLTLELGDETRISSLLEQGADPNLPLIVDPGKSVTPYQWAQQHGRHLNSFTQLQKIAQESSPLHNAIKDKDISAILRHAKNKNLINRFDINGNSPLQLAILEDVSEAIPPLVEQLTNHENRDFTLMQSVSLVLFKNQCHLLPFLSGIDKEIAFGEHSYQIKATPLMLAIHHGYIEATQSLLSQEVDLYHSGIMDGKKTTPIQMMLTSDNPALHDIAFHEIEKKLPLRTQELIGPKQKNIYTTLFEDLIHQILRSKMAVNVTRVEDEEGRIYFNLTINGHEYAMRKLAHLMDWEQLRLRDEDYELLRNVYGRSELLDPLVYLKKLDLDPKFDQEKYEDLNQIDANVIKHYTTGFSYKINDFLKGNKINAPNENEVVDWWIYSAFFTNALNKIKPETTLQKFCRGQLFAETPLRQRELTFISTSPDIAACESYSKGEAIVWLSKAYGKEITALSDHPKIREFVIAPSTLHTESIIGEWYLKGEPNSVPECTVPEPSLVRRKV